MDTIFSYKKSIAFSFILLSSFTAAQAQAVSLSNDTSNFLVVLFFACLMFLVVLLAALMGDKIIKLAADKLNVSNKKGIIPGLSEIFPCDGSADASGSKKKIVNLRRGFDIKLNGAAKKELVSYQADTYAVKPTDFKDLKPIPKMQVKEGDTVKAGDKLFFDKGYEGIYFTAPVSGTVSEIKRGEQRAITDIVITPDGKNAAHKFNTPNLTSASRDEVVSLLAESGAFTFFTERPFGLIPQLTHTPKAIHVSTFDTAPYAVDYNFLANKLNAVDFQKGLDVLNKLAKTVYLNLNKDKSAALYENAQGVVKTYFGGAHPAGNVGVQIHHIDPIRKGDYVWTIKAEDVANIGKLFNEGVYEPKRFVAVAGSVLNNTFYAETLQGAHLKNLVEPLLTDNNTRIVSGNPLTGTKVGVDGYLGFHDNVVSAIEEGNEYEAFGWMLPQYARPSISPTFPWKAIDFMKFDVNTNTHGEKRAFVVTGQYEEVLPMDIYPQYLMKAIIKNDFEEMEGLGIYEVIEEDVALCEFVCTSKQPLQAILREGLDYVYSQS